MTTYERLASSPDAEGVAIYDRKFRSPRIKGLYCDGNIAVSDTLETDAEKACVLSEELGHYHTTEGIIIDQSSVANRKQELRARLWGYNKLIGLHGIISCHKAHYMRWQIIWVSQRSFCRRPCSAIGTSTVSACNMIIMLSTSTR